MHIVRYGSCLDLPFSFFLPLNLGMFFLLCEFCVSSPSSVIYQKNYV